MKINLGGGEVKKEGFTNFDCVAFPTVDIVCDLTKGIPLPDSSVEEVYSAHFLEHLEDVPKMMKEIYRVCQPNALVKIKVPYFKSIGAFKDPTHKSFFTEGTLEYFSCEKDKQSFYQNEMNFEEIKTSYIWSAPWIRFLPCKKFFLRHFWNIARTIHYELRVIK